MTYLVTGSSGHLGEALVRVLRSKGEAVRSIDVKQGAFTDLVGHIADTDLVTTAMSGVRHVLHAATLHKPHVKTHSRQDFIDTNISGTQTLSTLRYGKALKASYSPAPQVLLAMR
tara:strand:+ start:117 stop:461 length:345 start_codon:yes stop_codon:yes gene_type:complete